MMVLDVETNQLHHLNPLATAVWAELDAPQTIPAIAANVSEMLGEFVSNELVVESVRLLSAAKLLERPYLVLGINVRKSRRAGLRPTATGGTSMIPAIVSVTVPAAPDSSVLLCPEGCPDFGPNRQPACCDTGDDCTGFFGSEWGVWNCTGAGQIHGVPKGCCISQA
jgi:hypothetical protein